MNNHANLTHPSALSKHVAVFPAINKRAAQTSNIWFFDSPKNNARLTIISDMLFMQCVLLEGDQEVHSYKLHAHSCLLDRASDETSSSQLQIYLSNGQIKSIVFRENAEKGRGQKRKARDLDDIAKDDNEGVRIVTENHLRAQSILFDNWLTLCAAISRCRSDIVEREIMEINDYIKKHGPTRYGDLIRHSDDPARMHAAAGRLLQRGLIKAELRKSLFGYNTILSRVNDD